MTDTAYPLERTPSEFARLRAQAEAFAPEAVVLLDRIGVSAGWRCLDLGCGAGGITDVLSARAAPGLVVGLDPDLASLTAARRWARTQALDNVAFIAGDAFAHALRPLSFDLVHIRFVMTTISRHRELVDAALPLVRPGGWLAVQEADAISLACYPVHPAWDRLRTLLFTTFEGVGGDPFAGRHVYRLIVEAGLEDVGFRPCVVGMRHGDPLGDFLPQTVLSTKPAILKHGLATAEELDRLIAECRHHLAQPTTAQTSVLALQAWGRKAAPPPSVPR